MISTRLFSPRGRPGAARSALACVLALTLLALFAGPWGRSAVAAPMPMGAPALAVAPSRIPCADLRKVDLGAIGGSGSAVASAAEGKGAQPGTVCIVEGVLAPAIRFRVELPTATWQQRYLQTGCGGLCGNLRIDIGAADQCPAVQATGFVVASTDMGHAGQDSAWTRDPRRAADFAYRGVHLTTVAAKALIRAYYGQAERFSYFTGCSDGGREALVEAQRFPQDFDGIVAGAPAMNFQVQNSLFHGWQARSNTAADGSAILLGDRLAILHAAVLKACDGQDGQVDGLLSAPGLCRFDPASIVCAPRQDKAACLTPAEAMVARKFYDGPRDPKTGERLTQGGPQYGSELSWAGVYVPQDALQPIFSAMIAGSSSGLIFPDGKPASVTDMVFDRATFDRLRERHALFDATNPDLSPFAARGGKLILFHGWSDPHISPINTIAYHEAVRRQMGGRAEGFERLYLMPGMYHCSGGEGPSQFDLLDAVMAWVEGGRAPDAIVTRTAARGAFGLPDGPPRGPRPDGAPGMAGPPPGIEPPAAPAMMRSRPVYPYPHVAHYDGKGDPNAAESYGRGEAIPVDIPAWAGSDFYRPYPGATR